MHVKNATSDLASTDRVEENLCDGEDEANCKTKPREKGATGSRTGRRVVLAGGRSVRIGADSGYTVPEYLSASGSIPRRGRALRRQLGDVLCLRQRERRKAAPWPASGLVELWLRRLPLWRLWLRLAQLRRLRLRRLLLLVGTLPPLLRARVPTASKDMICHGRVALDPASTYLLMAPTQCRRVAALPQTVVMPA